MEESLKKQIKLLEEIVELQKKMLGHDKITTPVYVYEYPYPIWVRPYYPPYIDPWHPWRGPTWTGSSAVSDNTSYTITDLGD